MATMSDLTPFPTLSSHQVPPRIYTYTRLRSSSVAPAPLTPKFCAMKGKSEMRWVDLLSVATHPYDFSSWTDSEDPTGTRKLISVLDTHPHVCPAVQCRWDRPHIGTCKTYIPPPFYVLVRVATRSYGHNE